MTNKKHKTVAESLEEGFREVGKITAPKKELLDGTLGNEILNDVLGLPNKKRKK